MTSETHMYTCLSEVLSGAPYIQPQRDSSPAQSLDCHQFPSIFLPADTSLLYTLLFISHGPDSSNPSLHPSPIFPSPPHPSHLDPHPLITRSFLRTFNPFLSHHVILALLHAVNQSKSTSPQAWSLLVINFLTTMEFYGTEE